MSKLAEVKRRIDWHPPSWRDKSQNTLSFITINTNEMKLYTTLKILQTEDHWAANKGYVDTQIANIDIPRHARPEPGNLLKTIRQILSTKRRLQKLIQSTNSETLSRFLGN